jgi:hypothetical protein
VDLSTAYFVEEAATVQAGSRFEHTHSYAAEFGRSYNGPASAAVLSLAFFGFQAAQAGGVKKRKRRFLKA